MNNRHNQPRYRFEKTSPPPPPANETHEERVHRLLNQPMRTTVENDRHKFLAEWKRRVAADNQQRLFGFLIFLMLAFSGCARNWVNYPPQIFDDGKGGQRLVSARAAEFNGSDLIGGTTIDVSHSGVHVAASGGINNSVSTAEGYRTARYGIGAAALAATAASIASTAASASTSATQSNNAAGIAAGRQATAVAAGRNATTVRLAEIQAAKESAAAAAAAAARQVPPAAGSTINAITPAVVTPIP